MEGFRKRNYNRCANIVCLNRGVHPISLCPNLHLLMTFYRQLPSSGHTGCAFNRPSPLPTKSSTWPTKCLYGCVRQDRVPDVLLIRVAIHDLGERCCLERD